MTRLSDYTFVKEISGGSYGEVDLYLDKDGNEVAIKLIRKDESWMYSHLKMIENSINYMVKLSQEEGCHASISCYRASFETPYYIAIVMDYIDGYDLSALIDKLMKSSEKLKDDKIRKFMKYMGEALYYIHSHNIVHKDIKPDNVMFTENRLVLVDFDLICEKDDNECLDIIEGNTYFMAPEIFKVKMNRLRNKKGMDYEGQLTVTFDEWKKGDIFSMGGVFWELAYGRTIPTFRGEAKLRLIPDRYLEKPEWLSEKVHSIIVQMLKKDPSDRINTETLYELTSDL